MKLPHSLLGFLLIMVAGSACFYACKTDLSTRLTQDQLRQPEHALHGIDINPSVKVDLFASEPMLVNPTNMDIDHKGRVWVTEAYNYRNHLNPGNPQNEAGDRIVILEDTDGDGKADQSKIYFQDPEINSALGIAVLGNRVIVSCSPNMLVFTDLDGDDVPDKKDTLFTGIGGEQHDHGAHAFVFGPEGKLYFNFGNSGSQLKDKSGKILNDQYGRPIVADGNPYHQGMVFRCDLDGSHLEVLAHNFRNNYEVCVDAFGNMWQSDNDDDGNRGVRINYVMPYGNYGYRDEMTGAGWREARTGMHEEIPLRHWHLNDPGVVPNLLQTGAGSPAGMLIYEGTHLPEAFHNQLIHADAGPNVVRAYQVREKGAGFTAEVLPIMTGREDGWFRPIDVCTAPDGSVLVADWYDPGVGGHKVGDLQRGRIFRISAPGSEGFTTPHLDWSVEEGIIQGLQSPNIATRFLVWEAIRKGEKDLLPALTEMAASTNPRFQARALWALAEIDASEKWIDFALKNEDPNLRMTGIRMAQLHQPDRLLDIAKDLRTDAEIQVRRVALVALRNTEGLEAAEIWGQYALDYPGNDRWYLEALGIAAMNQPDRCFESWIAAAGEDWNQPQGREIVWRMRSPKALPYLERLILDPSIPMDQKYTYFRAFDFHQSPTKNSYLQNIARQSHPANEATRNLALSHMDPGYAKNTAAVAAMIREILPGMAGTREFLTLVKNLQLNDQEAALKKMIFYHDDLGFRTEAMQLLIAINGEQAVKSILMGPDNSQKWAALETMGYVGNAPSLQLIETVIQDNNQTMEARSAAIQAMGQGWSGEHRLQDLLTADKLAPELEVVAAQRLTQAIDSRVRETAMNFLGENNPHETLPPIAELVNMEGDIETGRAVYQQHCSACHQVRDMGINFGPNLSEIGTKLTKEAIYASILFPAQGINFGYEGYLIEQSDGTKRFGFIESETEDKIRLRMNGGISQEIPVTEIKSRTLMEQSLMPEGLENNMDQQSLIDLVSFLSSLTRETAMNP